jgi:hypothetical protein
MSQMVTGEFDKALFARYRALGACQTCGHDQTLHLAQKRGVCDNCGCKRFEPSAPFSAFEQQLLAANSPLVKTLVNQYMGEDKSPPRRGFSKAKREPGVEHLEWEEACACGMTGLLKALRGLDLGQGGLTKYTALKIRHELQSAIAKARVIAVPKGTTREFRPTGFDFFEDEEQMQRALLHRRDSEDVEPEPEDEPRRRGRIASAVMHFVTTRCRFKHSARISRARVYGLYEAHARLLGQHAVFDKLDRALLERGATHTVVGKRGWPQERGYAHLSIITIHELSRATLLASDA